MHVFKSGIEDKPARATRGRPRITERTGAKSDLLGVVDMPSVIEQGALEINFELICDTPIMFKKIIGMIKKIGAPDIYFKICPDRLKIYAVEEDRNEFYACILGERMTRYYTKFSTVDYEFQVKTKEIYKVINAINKNNNSVRIFFNTANLGSAIEIAINNAQIGHTNSRPISTTNMEPYDWAIEKKFEVEQEYKLQFELGFQVFKGLVNRTESTQFRIEKSGSNPVLYFKYDSVSGGNPYTADFADPVAIKLYSQIPEDDIFGVSVYLSNVKPIAGTLVSDCIHVSADEDRNMIFTIKLGYQEIRKKAIPGTEACYIKILSEIVRPDNKPQSIIQTASRRGRPSKASMSLKAELLSKKKTEIKSPVSPVETDENEIEAYNSSESESEAN